MRFSVYLRRFGKLIKLYKLHRSASGLYMWSHQSSDYVSYHDDGRYWIRSRGERTLKKLRQPLSGFTGAETLSQSVNTFYAPSPQHEDEGRTLVRPDDIVLELDGTVVVEVILSAEVLNLPLDSQRPNSVVHVRGFSCPVITVEAFSMVGNEFPSQRFPSVMKWVEGENVFFDHRGKI
jgi:hypothetical protein